MAFVAVHIGKFYILTEVSKTDKIFVGAGYHSPLKREKYQQICTNACETVSF